MADSWFSMSVAEEPGLGEAMCEDFLRTVEDEDSDMSSPAREVLQSSWRSFAGLNFGPFVLGGDEAISKSIEGCEPETLKLSAGQDDGLVHHPNGRAIPSTPRCNSASRFEENIYSTPSLSQHYSWMPLSSTSSYSESIYPPSSDIASSLPSSCPSLSTSISSTIDPRAIYSLAMDPNNYSHQPYDHSELPSQYPDDSSRMYMGMGLNALPPHPHPLPPLSSSSLPQQQYSAMRLSTKRSSPSASGYSPSIKRSRSGDSPPADASYHLPNPHSALHTPLPSQPLYSPPVYAESSHLMSRSSSQTSFHLHAGHSIPRPLSASSLNGGQSSSSMATVCTVCNRPFTRPRDLQRHIKEIHRKSIVARCEGEECGCGKTFRRKEHLKSHLRTVERSQRRRREGS